MKARVTVEFFDGYDTHRPGDTVTLATDALRRLLANGLAEPLDREAEITAADRSLLDRLGKLPDEVHTAAKAYRAQAAKAAKAKAPTAPAAKTPLRRPAVRRAPRG